MVYRKPQPNAMKDPLKVTQQMTKRRHGSPVASYIGGRVHRPILHEGRVVGKIAEEVLQHHTRDLINRTLDRWICGNPCGSLDPKEVMVVDNSVVLPELGVGLEDRNYVAKMKAFTVSVYGEDGIWPERDDLISKLSDPKLTRSQFRALAFHTFNQNIEQRPQFVVDFVQKYKHRKVLYDNHHMSWEKAFNLWADRMFKEENQQKEEIIDLEAICKRHPDVLNVYRKKKKLSNTPANKVKLVRHIMVHFNDYRSKTTLYFPYKLAGLIEELFPLVCLQLYKFCWVVGLNPDFRREANYYKKIRGSN